MQTYSIGQLAEGVGVPTSTVRFTNAAKEKTEIYAKKFADFPVSPLPTANHAGKIIENPLDLAPWFNLYTSDRDAGMWQ